jgi:Type IV secretion-system coupling protein DNA-binding domain
MDEWRIVLGLQEMMGRERPFVLSPHDRRHHLYTIGKSGTGKTTFLHNLLMQDIAAGHGVGVIDPHGDLASELLNFIPSQRIEDMVYFNPADMEYPIGFNLLGSTPPDNRHLVASGVVNVFKSTWPDFWGPRMEYILYATVAALLDCNNVSLLGIQKMLSDGRYRSWVIRQIEDPMVRSFWVDEFERFNASLRMEMVAPIQNKVGQLLMSPHLRNILGQIRSRIDARFMMDNGRIFIADVSKGKLGADKSNLLGALLVTQFELAAMSRSDVPESERRDFYLYVDEFQSFASESFVTILSEARKYGLCLTLSHQYTDQVRPEIRDAVFGNVGSIVAFRVGQRDAKLLENEFGGEYLARQFVDLENYQVCVRMLENGRHGNSFIGKTLPSWGERHDCKETIVRRSREKYGLPRNIIEDRIRRWLRR